MGVGFTAAKFILSGVHMGMKLDAVCTLGRQSLFMKASVVASLLSTYHCCPADFWTVYPKNDPSPIADALFQILGATRIDALDNSAYEGANVVHDLNKPLPVALMEQYDLVLDAGTLEHVFHFPTVLENAMRMVKPGGDIIFIKPANGLCGTAFISSAPSSSSVSFAPSTALNYCDFTWRSITRCTMSSTRCSCTGESNCEKDLQVCSSMPERPGISRA